MVNIYDQGPDAIPDFQAALDNKGWDPTTYTWPARLGEVLEIIWINTGSLVMDNGGVDYRKYADDVNPFPTLRRFLIQSNAFS